MLALWTMVSDGRLLQRQVVFKMANVADRVSTLSINKFVNHILLVTGFMI